MHTDTHIHTAQTQATYHRLDSRMVHGQLLMILLAMNNKFALDVVYSIHIVETVATVIQNTTWLSDVVSTNH